MRRTRHHFAAATSIAAALLVCVPLAQAQTAFSDVGFTLVVELRKTYEWLNLHNEVLGASPELPRPVHITTVARRGESRSIIVDRPRFTVEISNTAGLELVKVTVAGWVTGVEALQALTPFEQAVIDIQTGVVENQVTLTYGATVLKGQFNYLKLSSP